MSAKEYDILLFGVTGFTGKLATEYLLRKNYDIKWGVCGRSEERVAAALKEAMSHVPTATAPPPSELCDLVCKGEDDEAALRAVVRKAKVVITTAGPFEKYGPWLIKACAEEGVDYCDITGESDFVRAAIGACDEAARRTGAQIVPHCGQDCIPWDLTVLQMHEHAAAKGLTLAEAHTYTELADNFEASGGTVTTAMYQLGEKKRPPKTDFDPLLRDGAGAKAAHATKVLNPKSDYWNAEFERYAGPWIMGPVMANCVRRSNALLGYADALDYSDAMLRPASFGERMRERMYFLKIGLAMNVPPLRATLPASGEGPTRATMESGFLKLHGRATAVNAATGETVRLRSCFGLDSDPGYMATARMIVEAGMVLLRNPKRAPGVTTPACALRKDIIDRLVSEAGGSFELSEVEEAAARA